MIETALGAARQIFTPPFRTVFLKSLGLTLLLLGALWALIEKLFTTYVHLPYGWLQTLANVLTGLGLFVAVAFLVTPVSFVVAGFFFDELAEHVEDEIAGPAGRGRAVAFLPALWISLKFAAVSLVVNLFALLLLLVPGINAVAFFGANAYLLGRGFFELAALRHVPEPAMAELRQRNGIRIFLAGCLVAALAAVPIVNLIMPLFAAALLVRVAAQIRGRARLAHSA